MFSNYPTNDDGLDYFTFVTLIDITKTDIVRHYNKEMPEAEYQIKRNQHRNYQTMLQVLGLRVQAVYLTVNNAFEIIERKWEPIMASMRKVILNLGRK